MAVAYSISSSAEITEKAIIHIACIVCWEKMEDDRPILSSAVKTMGYESATDR